LNYKKVIFKIMIGIVGIFALYFGIHTYANGQLVKTYAKGFEQNPLGDYRKTNQIWFLQYIKLPFSRHIPIYQCWLEEAIINMYQSGMSTREISKFIGRILGNAYSPTTISHITDVVKEDIVKR